VIAALLGVGVIPTVPVTLLTKGPLVGWDVGVALYLTLIHVTRSRCCSDRMRARAAEQDEGAFAILILTMLATFASMIALVFALGGSKQAVHAEAAALIVMTIVTIVLSWLFVHTIFAL